MEFQTRLLRKTDQRVGWMPEALLKKPVPVPFGRPGPNKGTSKRRFRPFRGCRRRCILLRLPKIFGTIEHRKAMFDHIHRLGRFFSPAVSVDMDSCSGLMGPQRPIPFHRPGPRQNPAEPVGMVIYPGTRRQSGRVFWVLLRSGRPRGPGKAFKTVGGHAATYK